MHKKRGLIFLVFLLLIPVVYSQSLTCEDGTRFASCKENTNLFCSDRNLILNGGFEADSSQDGIPNLFSRDPYANIGTDLIHSTDALSGLKSILITKQWASFDYTGSQLSAILLQPNREYIFFAFVKGNCQNLRVFYSQSQTGTANELCGSNKICNLIPFGGEWKRLVTQFNSNEIKTIFAATQVPFIQNLRVECADSTPFQLFVDNMHLQPVDAPPQLTENCQICGSCPSGLFCAPDGSCVDDLSSFYTDEELMVKCIAEKNFELCEKIQNQAAKPLASNLFATENNDIEKCQDVVCQQSVLYFNCLEAGRSNCKEESLSAFEQNPSFLNGKKIYIRENTNTELKRYKLESENIEGNKCDIHVQERLPSLIISTKADWYLGVDYGTIIPHTDGSRFFDYITYFSYKPDCEPPSLSICEGAIYEPFGIISSWKKDCSDSSCNILRDSQNQQYPLLGPKADLLCGYDDRWYLCDRDGIKEFDNNKKYLCNGASGAWVELN